MMIVINSRWVWIFYDASFKWKVWSACRDLPKPSGPIREANSLPFLTAAAIWLQVNVFLPSCSFFFFRASTTCIFCETRGIKAAFQITSSCVTNVSPRALGCNKQSVWSLSLWHILLSVCVCVCVHCIVSSFFLYCSYWHSFKQRCCSARLRDTPPPPPLLFFSRLLSLGPNYAAVRAIDSGETERPQQAARGPS